MFGEATLLSRQRSRLSSMPQETDGQNLIKLRQRPRQSHDGVHTPHHLGDTTASTHFVSWQGTEIVKNSASVSKCRLLINFNFPLALQGASEQASAPRATYTQVHATRTPVIINSLPGLSATSLEGLCLFLLYPRRNKPQIASYLFIHCQLQHLEILDHNHLINAKLIDDNCLNTSLN